MIQQIDTISHLLFFLIMIEIGIILIFYANYIDPFCRNFSEVVAAIRAGGTNVI